MISRLNSNVYASLSEGYKAGGYATYECTDPYDPEEVTSLEFGFKGNLSDNTIFECVFI